jgi:UDP-glucose 4-epimerase
VAIYANNSLAKEKLGWEPKTGIEDMMRTAWQWEVSLRDKALSN